MNMTQSLVGLEDPIIITGAGGFIGSRLVRNLICRGYQNVKCLVRSPRAAENLQHIASHYPGHNFEVIVGNLLSRSDCDVACRDASVVFHLAAGTGEKSFPDAYMNSVVATRNLVEASLKSSQLKRFVNVSSFAVYSNQSKISGRILDETCPIERGPFYRGDAYCFAKVKQDELIVEYGRNSGLPYVLVRPGSVFGPGKTQITGRVGLGTFGVFLHLGGSNRIPFTYVDNCADAIALAGLTSGIDREVFNIVDDDLPTSRAFLKLYKQHVKPFHSVYLPSMLSYFLCIGWEKYSSWSQGQLPPLFNRRRWHVEWKSTRYSNAKLKAHLGWTPQIPMREGLRRFFEHCREKQIA